MGSGCSACTSVGMPGETMLVSGGTTALMGALSPQRLMGVEILSVSMTLLRGEGLKSILKLYPRGRH